MGRGWRALAFPRGALNARRARARVGRWFNHLCPAVKKGEWTVEEDMRIMAAVQQHGTKVLAPPGARARALLLSTPPPRARRTHAPLAHSAREGDARAGRRGAVVCHREGAAGQERQRDQEPLLLRRAQGSPVRALPAAVGPRGSAERLPRGRRQEKRHDGPMLFDSSPTSDPRDRVRPLAPPSAAALRARVSLRMRLQRRRVGDSG